MAYNSLNHKKQVHRIVELYKKAKESDIPDTRIVSQFFPKHGVFISYRTWMGYKSMKPSEYAQPQQGELFSQAS